MENRKDECTHKGWTQIIAGNWKCNTCGFVISKHPMDWRADQDREKYAAKPSPYAVRFHGHALDPYRIVELYKITHPAHQHALKKLLRAGRSHKDLKTDIQETIATLIRWLEMIAEDAK